MYVGAHHLSDVVCAALIGMLSRLLRRALDSHQQSEIRNLKSEIELAEGVGFEPTRTFALPVFKTGAINRSTTPPT